MSVDEPASVNRRTALKVIGAGAGAPVLVPARGSATPVGLRRTGRVGDALTTEIPSVCDMCFWHCGIVAQVRDGRVVRVAGNPDHPRSRGRLCARGTAGWRQLEDPDRLRTPLLRVGKRGEGRWKWISWDQALDLWAEKTRATVKAHGAGSIGLFSHGLSSRFFNAFMRHLGTPNRTAPSAGQCRGPRDVGFQLTFGQGPGSPARHDMARSRMIVLLGCHIGENVQTGQVAELADALDAGARLVVADPRMSVVASRAHRWLPIRPGTDTALLLAWIHVLLKEGSYDQGYVARYTMGIEALRRELAPYTPEWAAEVTQLDRAAIVAEAREMARRRPAVLIHCGRFSAWYGNDTQRARAMAILTALLGAWGRPGGYYLRSRVALGPSACPPPHGDMAPSVATGQHAFTHHGVAAQELVAASVGPKKRIHQWIFYAVNPEQSIPAFAATRQALEQVDFITMVDILPTDGARWADLILPEATYLERYDDVYAVKDHPFPFVALPQPAVAPAGEAREPYWIAQQLAHRLGHTDCFTHRHVTGYLDARLAPLGLTWADLAREGIHRLPEQTPYLTPGQAHRFHTPSGRIELDSDTLKRKGYDPVPRFEPVAPPGLGWFRLVAGRSPYHSFARTQNNPRLQAHAAEPELWLNDAVARAKGLRQGARVFLQNQDGVRTGPVRVLVTPAIRTDVVYMEHGFGSRSRALHRACGRGISDNALASRFAVDPPSGATGFRVNRVQLVTRSGREIPGMPKAAARERAPLSPPPQGAAPLPAPSEPVPSTPGSHPAPRARSATPRPVVRRAPASRSAPPDPGDDVFRVKPEDGC